MPDLLMKQVLAVIDSRTTVICLHAAGQIRQVDDPFETLVGEQDDTPFHVHCRSMVMPWMPGFVNDLRKDANAELMRRPLKQRRIGPGGEIGGSLPPKVGPSGTPPMPTAETLTRASFTEDQLALMKSWIDTNLNMDVAYWLRQGGKASKQVKAAVEGLDEILAVSPLAEQKTLYRGMWGIGQPYGPMPKIPEAGDLIEDAAFLSTTESREVAAGYANVERIDEPAFMGVNVAVFEIDYPAGMRVLPIEDLSPGSYVHQEWLADRKMRYRVTDVVQERDRVYRVKMTAEVIPDA